MRESCSAPGRERDPRQARASFADDLVSARRARDFVAAICGEWNVRAAAASAQLVATELVENAVRHSRSACTVSVELTDRSLTIAVDDSGPGMPRLRHPATDEPGGRGLQLVSAIAADWGCRPTETGKRVWAVVDVG